MWLSNLAVHPIYAGKIGGIILNVNAIWCTHHLVETLSSPDRGMLGQVLPSDLSFSPASLVQLQVRTVDI